MTTSAWSTSSSNSTAQPSSSATTADTFAPRRTDTLADAESTCTVGAVQLAQRHRRPPDITTVVGLEQPGAKDHGGEGQRGLFGPDVERRQHDQVPQVLDGSGALAVSGRARRRNPLRRGKDPPGPVGAGQEGPAEPQAVAHGDVPVPEQRARPGAEERAPPVRAMVDPAASRERARAGRAGAGGGPGRCRRCGRERPDRRCSSAGRRAGRCRTRPPCARTTM